VCRWVMFKIPVSRMIYGLVILDCIIFQKTTNVHQYLRWEYGMVLNAFNVEFRMEEDTSRKRSESFSVLCLKSYQRL